MLYDPFGRPCVNTEVSGTLNVNIVGITIAGATEFRIYAGHPQILNRTTNLWHDIYIENEPVTGDAIFAWDDNPGIA